MDASRPPAIVLLGAAGMLGRAFHALLDARAIPHACPPRDQIDLAQPRTLTRIPASTQLVINCAAWTDVDGAEANEAQATLINGHGVGALAHHCAAINATLVHYCTDYVFPGNADSPYPPDAPLDPINAYGRSKAVGEQAIAHAGCDHLLIRTSWLYAPWGHNFVRTMARLLTEKPKVRVVNDQRGRPTCCRALAKHSLALLDGGHRGTWHITDAGACTWYELTCHIAHNLDNACPVEPCASDEFPRPAPRPAYSVLDISHTQHALGPLNDWRHNVTATLRDAPTTPAS